MTGPASPSSPEPSSSSVSSTRPPARRPSWLVPAGTFLAGCVLGGIVVGVAGAGAGDDAAPPSAAAAVDPDGGRGASGNGSAEDEDTEAGPGVRVPDSCVQTAEDATTLVEHVDQVVAAVADLEPERLRQTVDGAQQVRDRVDRLAEQCRADAAQRQQAADTQTDGAAVGDPATPAS